MKNSKGFGYIGKFCFQDTNKNSTFAGMADIEIKYSGIGKSSDSWFLMMYDDSSDSWFKIHNNNDLTCEDKRDNYYRYRNPINFLEKEKHSITVPIREHTRPRWWWVYIVNCDIDTNSTLNKLVSDVSYKYHFYQYKVTMWNKEAGVNDRGLNTVYLFYLCFYVLLFGTQLYGYHVYRSQNYVHQVIKLLTSVIGCQLFAVLFSFIDWMIFTENGSHELFFEIMGEIGYVASNTIFLLLLLVLGQGWTISRFEVSWPKTILLVCILNALTQCGIFIWILVGFDEETTRYYYDTLPEWIFGALYIVVGIVYIVECIQSFRTETLDSKRRLFVIVEYSVLFCFVFVLFCVCLNNNFLMFYV